MMFLLVICSALLTAGAALECEVCVSLNSNSCSGHYELCKSPQSRCLVTLTETTLKDGNGEMKSAVLEKSCGSFYNCSHPATLTTEKFRVRVTTMCCNQDYCNKGTMDCMYSRRNVQPEHIAIQTDPDKCRGKQTNSTVNGVSCLSCFEKNSQSCDVKTRINCTGDEMHCVQYLASRKEGSTITVAGCASESMKKSEGRAAFQGSSVTVHGMKNTNNGESLRTNSFLLPFLAVLTTVSILLQ